MRSPRVDFADVQGAGAIIEAHLGFRLLRAHALSLVVLDPAATGARGPWVRGLSLPNGLAAAQCAAAGGGGRGRAGGIVTASIASAPALLSQITS